MNGIGAHLCGGGIGQGIVIEGAAAREFPDTISAVGPFFQGFEIGNQLLVSWPQLFFEGDGGLIQQFVSGVFIQLEFCQLALEVGPDGAVRLTIKRRA